MMVRDNVLQYSVDKGFPPSQGVHCAELCLPCKTNSGIKGSWLLTITGEDVKECEGVRRVAVCVAVYVWMYVKGLLDEGGGVAVENVLKVIKIMAQSLLVLELMPITDITK